MDVSLHLSVDEPDLIAACVRQERWAQQRVYEEYGPLGLEIVSLSFQLRDDADAIAHKLRQWIADGGIDAVIVTG